MGKLAKKFFAYLLDFAEIVLIAVTVFVIVYLFVAQLLEVTGNSMYPTFKDKEQIIAEKVSVKLKELERGEIIIVKSPKDNSRLLIKRVIGLPGERIMVNGGKVFINGGELYEPYLAEGASTYEGALVKEGLEYQIALGSYFLLGDNREQSSDSREYGTFPNELIVGRGVVVYYPLENFRFITQE